PPLSTGSTSRGSARRRREGRVEDPHADSRVSTGRLRRRGRPRRVPRAGARSARGRRGPDVWPPEGRRGKPGGARLRVSRGGDPAAGGRSSVHARRRRLALLPEPRGGAGGG